MMAPLSSGIVAALDRSGVGADISPDSWRLDFGDDSKAFSDRVSFALLAPGDRPLDGQTVVVRTRDGDLMREIAPAP